MVNYDLIRKTAEILSQNEECPLLRQRRNQDMPLPSVEELHGVMDDLRAVLFPGYFGPSDLKPGNMAYTVSNLLDRICTRLSDQIGRGCLFCERSREECDHCRQEAQEKTDAFLERLPEIRRRLSADVQAAYEGDPAAKHPGEAIFCYPSIRALANYRVAHALHELGVPLVPRIITEMAHSETGIDIHPGATIFEGVFMDHGTGIVIGETTEIGARVRIYQGVTLGARSFPLDDQGRPIKGVPRHPIVEDDVIIYSGATILGRVRIGKGSVIGGNVWLTRDVPPNSRIVQGKAVDLSFRDGAGI